MTPSLRPTLFRILTLTVISNLLLTPAFVSGALFPKNSLVKTIDAKEFRQVMKLNVRRFYIIITEGERICFSKRAWSRLSLPGVGYVFRSVVSFFLRIVYFLFP
jgi:hypothetical protein